MSKTVAVAGIDPAELPSIRMLLFLLRHSNPIVPELAHQALSYVAEHIGTLEPLESNGTERHHFAGNLVS